MEKDHVHNNGLSAGVMIDCSRNAVMKVSQIKKFASLVKKMGYDNIGLYMEDTYEIPEEQYFGHLRGRYTKKELREINDYLKSVGIRFIPYIQTLAHLKTIFQWSKYQSVKDINDILLVGEEKTYDLIEKMFLSLRDCIDGDEVHIGMDEAFLVGFGEYLKRNGYKESRTEIILFHLNRVSQIAKKYGFKTIMWSDLFYRLDVGKRADVKVPENVALCNWDYYSDDVITYVSGLRRHKKITNDLRFAGGAWTWTGFAPQNEFANGKIKRSAAACRKENVNGYVLTMWGDDGAECSYFAALPTLFFTAEKFLNEAGIKDIKKNFKEKFGISYDLLMKLDLPNSVIDKRGHNVSKWGFYNDPFCGKLDFYVEESDGEKFRTAALKLARAEKKAGEYSYIFKTLKDLCRVLEYKFTLGVITRKAYLTKNNAKLNEIANVIYPKIIKRTEIFYESFKNQWYNDNKPFGFEVQDMRIGGVIMRLKHCRETLNDYLNGKTDRIEELEQPVLPLDADHKKGSRIGFNDHVKNVTANFAHWKAPYDL